MATGTINENNVHTIAKDNVITREAAESHTFSIPAGGNLFLFNGNGSSRNYYSFIFKTGATYNPSSTVIYKGDNVSATLDLNSITLTFNGSTQANVRVINIWGGTIT